MKRLVFHEGALAEYHAAVDYYQQIDVQLGKRFRDEMESLLCRIGEQPSLGSFYQGSTRRRFSRKFPYAIIYRDDVDRVLILSVMHMHREPFYWVPRLTN